MDDVEAGRAGQHAPHQPKAPDDYSTGRLRERGLHGIARGQITPHGRLSKLSKTERRQALAQWLRGMHP